MKSLIFYNSLTRQKEVFTPINPGKIGVYVCGPTVYDFAHIGNARPFVVFDIVVRLLRYLYPQVVYVRNITDVDDKINKASLQSGLPITTITQRTIQAFHEDMSYIGALTPDIEPRATDHIPDMIQMIETLIRKGYAYVAENHVLFHIKKFADYGALSNRNIEEMQAGARVEVAPYKQDPGDFVLWKPSDDSLPGWPSPWGRGRPGWHIECSAMGSKYLGTTFDIHAGGIDLIFPHHENEIAQSCCAFDVPRLANYWLHNGHVTVNGEKMSKSLGNFLTIRDLSHHHSGEVLRLALLMSHYRQPLDWTDDHVNQAKQTLDRLYNALRGISIDKEETPDFEPEFLDALLDDLNLPLAITLLHQQANHLYKTSCPAEKIKIAQQLKTHASLLGLLQQDPEVWFQQGQENALEKETIEQYLLQRQQARHQRQFAEADRIRQFLLEKGVIVEDSASGNTTWRYL